MAKYVCRLVLHTDRTVTKKQLRSILQGNLDGLTLLDEMKGEAVLVLTKVRVQAVDAD